MKPFDTLIFIMDIPQRSDLLKKLRNYLIFLKDYGYSEIPMELTPSSLHGFKKNKSSPHSVETPQKQTMNNPKLVSTQSLLSVEDVQKELGECIRCKLHATRKSIVFGSGNPNAELVFVGEGPGADEDEQGFPFVGRAGKKLTEIIEKGMKLNRDKDTYICNIVKCRPPNNRDPEADEIASCKPFLIKQIQAIQPKAIVALGKPAASTLLGRTVPIMKERGNWHKYEGIPLMLTLHPAYLMRAYTLENRRNVMNDMNKVLKLLHK